MVITNETKKSIVVKELSRRIEKGVMVLDKKFGRKNWLNKIDVKILDLSSHLKCVCGQAFGDYFESVFGKNDFQTMGEDERINFAKEHGFTIEYPFFFDFLTNLWYVKIVELKIKAKLIP